MTIANARDSEVDDLLHAMALYGNGCCDTATAQSLLEKRIARDHEDAEPAQRHDKYPESSPMKYIAMNRFKVKKGSEQDFEAVWLNREVHLNKVPGFMAFHLLRGPERDDHVLYSSHTLWASEDAFLNWTRSEAFRAAHKNAGGNKPLYLGHPEFEGFTILQEIEA